MSSNGIKIENKIFTDRFKRDYKKLSPDLKIHVDNALKGLERNPIPSSLRFEKLKGYKNPNIYSIHVTSNHSHKITFEILSSTAIFRRIGTHKEIDTEP